MTVDSDFWRRWKDRAGLWGGLLLFVSILVGPEFDAENPAVRRTAAVAALMAVWWMTEALPLAATALVPLILFPLLGVASGKSVAGAYMNTTIFLFLGGFLIALAMERWHLHKRIALRIILLFGERPGMITLGFMIAAAFLSMWISNTATAVMMLPIALAIISRAETTLDDAAAQRFARTLLLGVAWACSIGGVATLVGTPPNLILVRTFETSFPDETPLTFFQWMLFGVPFSIGALMLAWLTLTRIVFRTPRAERQATVDRSAIQNEYETLGPWSYEEKMTLFVFVATAHLWVFRAPLDIGILQLPGWSQWLPFGDRIDDGITAVCMALLLFLLPARSRPGALLDESVFRNVPWSIILLFGGGFALALGFEEGGLSRWIVDGLKLADGVNVWLIVALIAVGMTFLTELTSNTASTQMTLPVLAAVATAHGVHPLLLMLPATISASMAFMLPVATPPNAIVFSSERLRIRDMAAAGFLLNLLCAAWTVAIVWFAATFVLGIDGGAPSGQAPQP
jgi:solute carrier family 13 (sodium-dependent dicarboxylate transporter), member 2/3/5